MAAPSEETARPSTVYDKLKNDFYDPAELWECSSARRIREKRFKTRI